MTTLAVVQAPPTSPVPWSRLAWVAWRRYRATLGATVGVLALLAVDLVINGSRMRSAYAAAARCTPDGSANCRFAWDNFHHDYAGVGLVGVILVFLPGIIGVFAGAPVLAREFETGTFRFTFTQGVGRMRWAVAVLVPGAVGVAVVTGAFGMLVSWQNQPLVESGITQRLHTTVFPVTGIACAGWALAGFGVGVLAGVLWRRVVPALVSSFAVWFGLAFLTADSLRPHYLAAMTTTSTELAGNDLVLNQWWTKGGVTVSQAQIDSVLQAIGVQLDSGQKAVEVVPGGGGSIDPVQYLLQHGYQQVTSYQPDSRFWTFQWIEFGWLAAVTLLALAGALWILRRRVA